MLKVCRSCFGHVWSCIHISLKQTLALFCTGEIFIKSRRKKGVLKMMKVLLMVYLLTTAVKPIRCFIQALADQFQDPCA